MTEANKTILVVDDEAKLLEMIKMVLENRGYKVLEATNGQEGVTMARVMEPDLILMDVMMPLMDGFTACGRIREFSKCPIIMLTAKGEDYDQVNGLSKGADDYVVKPFTPMVLAARIEAVLRRSDQTGGGDDDKISYGDMVVDIKARDVIIQNQKITFNKKEFDLLVYMARNYAISLSRDQILEKVWGYDYLGSESTVDTHINRIRNKLGNCEKYLITVRGYGYKFEVNHES